MTEEQAQQLVRKLESFVEDKIADEIAFKESKEGPLVIPLANAKKSLSDCLVGISACP